MSAIIISLVIILIFITIALGRWILITNRHNRQYSRMIVSSERAMTLQEKVAFENYLSGLPPHYRSSVSRLLSRIGLTLPLRTLRNHQIYSLTHSIARYGLSTDAPKQWRYFLDTVEVHLPPLWEPYIAEENTIQLVYT